MTHVRSRWTALPLAAALAFPLLTALPASAATPGEYRGYLSDSAAGTRYIAYDANGAAVFTSTPDAVDGALGHVTDAGPTIAYVTEEDTDTSYIDRLHLVVPGGTDTVIYSGQPGFDVSEPSIAPNGRDVLFALDDDSTSAIVTVDASTRAVRTIRTSTSTDYYGPSFSPDGSYLSWAQQGRYYSDVVVARFSTGAASVISETSMGFVEYSDTAWSPTGTQLLAVRNQHDDSIDDMIASIAVIDVRTHATRVAVRGGVTSSGAVVDYVEPAWAGDGQTLLMTKLTSTATATTGELVALPPNQGGLTDPVATTGYAGSPSAAAPFVTDAVAPAPVTDLTAALIGASVHLTFALPADTDLADLVVTRVEGAPADTATATIEVARPWSGALDVPLPNPSTDYGISVFSRDWSGNLSPAAKVSVTSAAPSSLTVSTPPARIHWRTGVTLTGTLSNPAAVANHKVVLYARRAMTSTFVAVSSAITSSAGAYTLTYTPQWTAEYQVRFAGSSHAYPVVSAKRVVTVIPAVSLSASTGRIALGGTVTLSGSFGPNHAGQLVTIQRKVNGVWRSIASARLSSTSTYRLVLRPNARGTWELRTYKSADSDHAATSSPGRTVYVS